MSCKQAESDPNVNDNIMKVLMSIENIENKVGSFDEKIGILNERVKVIDTFTSIVNVLNTRCEKLEFENEELKKSLLYHSQTAEVKISQIPSTVTLPEIDIAKAILTNLNLETFHSSILSVRKVNYKSKDEHSMNTQSIIIQFASTQIRDFVVKTAKTRGGLFCEDIFPEYVHTHARMYANEFLSQSSHVLLQKAKEKAKSCNYKFVWARSGVVYARKDENSSAIPLITQSDLDKMI